MNDSDKTSIYVPDSIQINESTPPQYLSPENKEIKIEISNRTEPPPSYEDSQISKNETSKTCQLSNLCTAATEQNNLPQNDSIHIKVISPCEEVDDEFRTFVFSEKTVRHSFIRKVFLILMGQLIITAGFVALFLYHEPTKLFIWQTPYIFVFCVFVTMSLLIVLSLTPDLRRKTPHNYICLFIFTISKSITVAMFTSLYDSDTVLIAVGVTIFVCLALAIFAFQTRWDFTFLGSTLFMLLIILIGYGIMALIFQSWYLELIYASVGAFLFSVYLIYDIQLMIGGSHRYTISPEEYIFAALNLYIDIVSLFRLLVYIIVFRAR